MKSSRTLLLSGFDDYSLSENDDIAPLDYLPFVNKINILIGTNNSGKSKFIRKLMSLKRLYFLDENKFNLMNENIATRNQAKTHDYVELLKRKSSVETSFNIIKNNPWFSHQVKDSQKIKLISESDSPKFYYIPVLRTAHSLYQISKEERDVINRTTNYKYTKIEDDIFSHTLRKNYSLPDSLDIFTGIHLYKDILNARNSKRETRKKFEDFEKFIGRNFFDGKSIDIIAEFDKDASQKDDNTKEIINLHIEGERDSRNLFDLGDGIQALIILMYKIFMADNNSYIFIDEPEINLHPGMQRLFLEQIISNPDLSRKNLTYYISTHSNHFLDLTLEKDDVSIYSFYTKVESNGEKRLIIKNVNVGDNDVLKNIGVNNSSVFMANCSIWVEGISDRIYIRAFLKSYCKYLKKKYPKEDIDFAFFEYAGTNLNHYFFDNNINEKLQNDIVEDIKAMALSNRIFLLADSDNVTANSAKGKRLKKIEQAKSNNFVPEIIRTHREIENFLPGLVWEDVLIELCNKNIVASDKAIVESKIEDVLKSVKSINYSKKYIGEFLNEVRNKMGKISGKFIVNQSEYEVKSISNFGTLTNKRRLSEIISDKEYDWEVLRESKAIERLTINIYNFINYKIDNKDIHHKNIYKATITRL